MVPAIGSVHHRVIASFVDRGRAPSLDELAGALAVSPDEAAAGLLALEAEHGVVLHPGSTQIWIAHPFSASPTAVWVAAKDRGWWAPCMWCALGIVALAAPDATIHARYAGEAEPMVLSVDAGARIAPAVHVHFPIPARDAWENVVHWCASVLPFRSAADVAAWSARHAMPIGDIVPVDRVLALAHAWYGRHLDPDWRKWTVDEARAIFERVGLTSPTWQLPSAAGRF